MKSYATPLRNPLCRSAKRRLAGQERSVWPAALCPAPTSPGRASACRPTGRTHPAGFAAHWDKNSNSAWAFDTWFLNLFPRATPFTHNRGGYVTLSFIPTLSTMILGLLAGGLLRGDRPALAKINCLLAAGAGCLAAGWALDALGVVPNVKRIWTLSWVLFSGGWSFAFTAAFSGVIDVLGWRAWSFPLVVIGMNSIAAYGMDHLFADFIRKSLQTHLGRDTFKVLGPAYEPLLLGGAVLLVLWLILFWMYRRGIFLRV